MEGTTFPVERIDWKVIISSDASGQGKKKKKKKEKGESMAVKVSRVEEKVRPSHPCRVELEKNVLFGASPTAHP